MTTEQKSGRVRRVDPVSDPRWDEFVLRARGASVYHLAAWSRIMRSAYGFRPLYLALEGADGEIEGVLPMFHSRGPLSGNRLRSMPMMPPPSGPVATTREGLATLIEAARSVMEERGASQWVWASRDEGLDRFVPGLELRSSRVGWIAPLDEDPEAMRARLRRRSNNLHRSIRKAEAAELRVRESTSEDDLRTFYRLYLATMRDHLSIPKPYRQMQQDLRLLGPRGATRVFVVERDGRIVAGGLFHAFRDTVELLYNASDPRALELRPNHALYWHVMRWAIERGLRRFDFGDAPPDSSLGRFKQQWAAEPVGEFVYILSGRGGNPVGEAVRRQNPNVGGGSRRTALARAWARAPLQLTRLAGAIGYRL